MLPNFGGQEKMFAGMIKIGIWDGKVILDHPGVQALEHMGHKKATYKTENPGDGHLDAWGDVATRQGTEWNANSHRWEREGKDSPEATGVSTFLWHLDYDLVKPTLP